MPKPWEEYQAQPSEQTSRKPWEDYVEPQKTTQMERPGVPGEMIDVPDGMQAVIAPNTVEGYELIPQEQEPSFSDKAIGAIETAATMLTGGTTGAAGYVGGMLKGMFDAIGSKEQYGTQEWADKVVQSAEEAMQGLTYQPKTETGQEYTQEVGKALEPLQAIAPLVPEIAAATRAAKTAPIVARMSEEMDLLKSAIPESKKVQALKTAIKENPTDKNVAKYKIVRTTAGEKIIPDVDAAEAIKQGFKDGVIASVKASSDADKQKMMQMLNIHKAGRKSEVFAARNRPSDITGKSMQDRVNFLMSTRKNAGKELDIVAEGLRGKTVDYDPAINNFLTKLKDMGVSLERDKKGQLVANLSGSNIEGDIASKKLLDRVLNRLVNTKVPNAYDVHRAKQYLSTQVSYGKRAANPLSGETENIIKGLRADLNSALGEKFPKYKEVNTKYADSLNALDDLQKAAGTQIDLNGQNADKALGTSVRKLLSNYGSRVNMMDALDNAETVAKKYGMKPKDSILNQLIFQNEIDRMFGSHAPTSFKGQISEARATGTDLARGDKVNAALKLAEKGIEKVRGINEENAIKSIEKILQTKKKRKYR